MPQISDNVATMARSQMLQKELAMRTNFAVLSSIALAALMSTVAIGQSSKLDQDKPAAVKENSAAPLKVDAQSHRTTVKRAVDYLLQKGFDNSGGSYSKQLGPAVTAMCTTALLQNGVKVSNPQIQKSLKYLESFVKKDGGIYAPNSNLRNYETSVAVMCFAAANTDGKYDKIIEEAIGLQKNIQWDDGEGHDRASTFYGGQGYGKHKRPDMSNTSFFIDALKAASEDKDLSLIHI